MKKLIFLLLAVLPFIACGQKAKIQFEETSHQFGTIHENGGKVSHTFTFRNAGTAPLILTQVQSGCGCTTPEWSRQPVLPGNTGTIKVSFDPRNRPGMFVKGITVHSNAENRVMTLTVRGNVSRKPAGLYDYKVSMGPLRLTGHTLHLGDIKNTQTAERKIEVVNTGSRPATIQADSSRPYLSAVPAPATLAKGQKGSIAIKYDARQKNDWGPVNDTIQLTVNGRIEGEIIVTGSIHEDFSHYSNDFEQAPAIALSENRFVLNPQETGPIHHEFFVQNAGKSDLIIRKIETSDPHLSVTVPKHTLKPGKKIKASFTWDAPQANKTVKMIQFTTNDPKHPVVMYQITGSLK